MKNNKLYIFFGILLVLTFLGFNLAKADCIGATTNFTCGDYVTESCILNESMDCSAGGDGFGVNGMGVTIDCDGNRLIGDETSSGIVLPSGDANAIIQNCYFENWAIGVEITSHLTPTIQDNEFINVSTGISAGDDGLATFYRNNIHCERLHAFISVGIEVLDGMVGDGQADIQNNTINNCDTGLYIEGIETYVYNNNISGSVEGIFLYRAINNTVNETYIENSSFAGIRIELSDLNIIYNSKIYNSGVNGVYVMSDSGLNVIELNEIINVSEEGYGGIVLIGDGQENNPTLTMIIENIITDTAEAGINSIFGAASLIGGNNITKTRQSNGVYEQFGIKLTESPGNQIILNNIWNFTYADYESGQDDVAIYGELSDSQLITENNLTNNNFGIWLDDAMAEVITQNIISGNKDYESIGILLRDGEDHIIDQNSISDCNQGMLIIGYKNPMGAVEITSNNVTNSTFNGPAGILAVSITTLILEDNIVTNMLGGEMTTGISAYLVTAQMNRNSVDNVSGTGYYLQQFLGEFENNTATNGGEWDLYLEDTLIEFFNFTTDSTYIGGFAVDVAIKDTTSLAPPEGYKDIGIFYIAENTSISGEMNLQIYYDESSVNNETTLRAWKNNGTWSLLGDSEVYPDDDYVLTGTILSFSTFALMEAEWDAFPEVELGTPLDDAYLNITNKVSFSARCIDEEGISQMQLWTNITGNWTLRTIKYNPTSNVWWNYSYYSVPNGYYEWAVLCIDDALQEDWSDNRTFTMNYTGGGGGGGGGSSPYEEPTDVCCEYSCFFGFCSHQIVSSVECSALGGIEVEESKCGITTEGGNETIVGGTTSSGGVGDDVTEIIKNYWWILLIVGILLFLYFKNKK